MVSLHEAMTRPDASFISTTNAGRHLDAAQLILTTAVLTRTWNNATEADYTAAGTQIKERYERRLKEIFE